MRYWQHDETGGVATSEDDVDLSPRYYEISKEAYDSHEAYEHRVQLLAGGRATMKGKLILVCATHQDKKLVWSWEVHSLVCPVCGGTNILSVSEQSADQTHSEIVGNNPEIVIFDDIHELPS